MANPGNHSSPKIIALIGPTASGKSDLALRLARETGAEILSCDSLLVYRELTIGTAKPSAQELAEVKHYGIDLVALDEPFTAGDYVRYARPILDRAVDAGKPMLVVGGTGFYLKALLCGTWEAPPTQPEFRARLEQEFAHLEPEARVLALHERLANADPAYAAKINPNDVYRVVRALEIIEVTRAPVTEMLGKQRLQNPFPFKVPVLGLTRSKIELDRRIRERTNAMFANGLVNETKELLQRFGGENDAPRPFFCVGYNEVMQFLSGKMNLPETRERIMISTRQLAKKQMTFFKGQFPEPIEWYALPGQENELLDRARETLSNQN